jgi:cation diffusion facilitator CzcD-associated flavoprotein CzcO
MSDVAPSHVHVAIVGSGFGGIGTAIRLMQEGIHDFVVLERADDVGGTWRDNTYPGCACDVPSHLYSFSFAPNPEWSRRFSPQPEILEYLKAVAARYGVLPHVRLGHSVVDAAWDEGQRRWRLQTSKGTFTADVLVGAAGGLSTPSIPALKGLDRFQGKVFHSATWDHGVDLTGRDVAVIGNGASAIQFVPEIQPQVGRMVTYQRTPSWILPRSNGPVGDGARSLFRSLPAAQLATRGAIYATTELFGLGFRHPVLMKPLQKLALGYLEREVQDPLLRAKLTPNYTLGCKRILFSTKYYRALTQPNVEVVTDGIREVTARGIVTADGRERACDTIIFGTGFEVTNTPFSKSVRGRGGKTLTETWDGSPRAHLGTTVSGYPNFFIILGPNTGLGHTSVVYMIESQIEHVVNAVLYMREHGVTAVEPKPEVQAAFLADVDRRLGPTVWNSGGCASWYLDKTGRNSTLWPDATWRFRRRVQRFDPAEYQLSEALPVPLSAPERKASARAASAAVARPARGEARS